MTARTFRIVIPALLVCTLVGPAAAQSDGSKDGEVAELKRRIEQLEQRLAVLEKAVAGAGGAAEEASNAARQQRRAKFEARVRKDLQKYSREQVAEAEQLYQVANRNFGKPEAKESLTKMLEKYPDLNRTGCAVLYMGQMSSGDERETYLRRAVEQHGDSMYGDGVIVGAFARYLLAADREQAGDKDGAAKLYDEIEKLYPGAVDHSGKPLMLVINEMRKQ